MYVLTILYLYSIEITNCLILQHLVHLSWLCEGELVAVDVNPVSLIEQLPPTLKVKKFGVS